MIMCEFRGAFSGPSMLRRRLLFRARIDSAIAIQNVSVTQVHFSVLGCITRCALLIPTDFQKSGAL